MGMILDVENLRKWNEDTQRWPLWKRQHRSNPHAIYAQIREEEPILRLTSPLSGEEIILFTRYDDCVALLKDPRFIKDFSKLATAEEMDESLKNPATALSYHMLSSDPPDHTRLRTLVSKAFTPKMIAALEPRIQTIADTLISAMQEKGEADLIDDFAFPLPITVIAEMLGIPLDERDQFRVWSRVILFSRNPQQQAEVGERIIQYFMEVFEKRRADPQDDLISVLLNVEEQRDHLSYQELLSMIFLLLVAGHETTVNLIGNGVNALFDHPDQFVLLREQPALIESAIEEMLRYECPLETTPTRFAAEDTEWDGVPIKRRQFVYAGLLSANRDPLQFPNPDVFDITRTPNKHIAFGNGIHYCLGAPLARIEGAIAISTLLRRIPDLTRAIPAEDLYWNDMITLRGVQALPVRL